VARRGGGARVAAAISMAPVPEIEPKPFGDPIAFFYFVYGPVCKSLDLFVISRIGANLNRYSLTNNV
jgi:hypothetical protein